MAEQSSSSGDRILVAFAKGDAFVHVEGRGTFKVSNSLKAFGCAAAEKESARLILDLRECVGMDSTFMGVMAGLARRFEAHHGRVLAINLSEKTEGLLQTLGLDQVVECHRAGQGPDDIVPPPKAQTQAKPANEDGSRKEMAALMLEAHEQLVELSPENYPRFKDVLAFIREDLDAASPEDPSDPARKT